VPAGFAIPQDPPTSGLLAGRVAVVTAAAGTGIGGAVARRFAREGAALMISDRSESRLAETRDRLAAEVDTPVMARVCDVTDGNAIENLYEQTERDLGPIDIAFNNAGLGGSVSLVDMTDEEWMTVLDVTLNSTFRCTRALLRRMIPRGRGVVINNSSITGWRAEAGQCHYAAAKAGVMALTRCAAAEAGPHGVRVNAIAPTITAHENLARAVDADTLAGWAAAQPQRRAAEPFEIAAAVAFLASDHSSYLTGEVLSMSGQHP